MAALLSTATGPEAGAPRPARRAASAPPDGPTRRAPGSQLVVLFGFALVNWSLGNGLLPILPSIAATLGATRFWTGIYLAASYAALAGGTVAAGILADRTGHPRVLMIAAGLAGAPLIFLASWATALWELAVLTASTWCLAGMAVTLVTIQGGLLAGPQERGRVLGFLAQAAPLGSIIGGFGVGALADAVGYPAMWRVLGVLFLLCPALGFFVLEPPSPRPRTRTGEATARMTWTGPFLLLLVAGVLGACGSFIGGLGRSFAMQTTFSNEAITSTVAVSGVVAFPLTILVGWMSDRRGRLPFIGLCYAAGVLGLLVYSIATSLVHFWIAASLVAIISYVSTGVGSALVVDLVDRPATGRALAYFGATGWAGAILAFSGGGFAFATFGLAPGFLLGAVLTVLAIAVLGLIALEMRRTRKE